MLFANINIKSYSNTFQYIIEYKKTENQFLTGVSYIVDMNIDNNPLSDIVFVNGGNSANIRDINHWCNMNIENLTRDYLPNNIKSCMTTLYLPSFSVDTYHTGHKYALNVGTWICGKYIVLLSAILDRSQAVACECKKNFFNEEYYECFQLPMIDPYELIYSDDWKLWRENVCGESTDKNLVNSVGSVLYCSLHPVIEYNNEYLKLDGYDGGQTSINISDSCNDYMNLNIHPNTESSLRRNERPSIDCEISFNKAYSKDEFENYLIETYGGREHTYQNIRYELIIADAKQIYTIIQSPIIPLTTTYRFTKDVIQWKREWGWKEGLFIKCSFELFQWDQPFMTVVSNNLPFSIDIYKYLVDTDFYDSYDYKVNNVNLDYVNMNFLNIDVVNKTINEVVRVDTPQSNFKNAPQTLFYRVTDTQMVILHPSINENICINLDKYKHLVKTFMIQIEGIKFLEIGRNQSGVVFKIIGSKLSAQKQEGIYYILNQDSELVTSGKYIFEI